MSHVFHPVVRFLEVELCLELLALGNFYFWLCIVSMFTGLHVVSMDAWSSHGW